ncbi:Oxidoreductase AflY [Diaporthe eres]|nr:Oxidoreductase AflY [Diaporthe eres]
MRGASYHIQDRSCGICFITEGHQMCVPYDSDGERDFKAALVYTVGKVRQHLQNEHLGVKPARVMKVNAGESIGASSTDPDVLGANELLPVYTNFLVLFERDIKGKGRKTFSNQYCCDPTPVAKYMFPQLFEGPYHLLIHVGFRIEFALSRTFAEGLAHSASREPGDIDVFPEQ